jgi:hypothetical protein
VLAYSIRIYCDFSGYTDMAIGLAHLFGYKLNNNFNMPYISQNVSEFWRRWHISLSSWLRDYLFIPLGGSRGSTWLVYRNLMITMTLGGLWHGAAWSYVLWGVAHGTLLIVHRMFKDFCEVRPRLEAALQTTLGTGFRVMFTFFCVSMCWVLFQPNLPPNPAKPDLILNGLDRALAMYGKLFNLSLGQALPLHNRSLWYTAGFVLMCHMLVRSGAWQWAYRRLPAPVLGVGYAVCVCTAMLLAPDSGSSFIYFNF